MFSSADLAQQGAVESELLAAGFTTYYPPSNGIEVAVVMGDVNGPMTLPAAKVNVIVTFVHKIVFALDVYQLVAVCDSIVFNMDGRVPDEGSVSETAIAFAANKPGVIFKTTPITMLGGQDNPLVQGLSTQWQYVSEVTAIPAALDAAVSAQSALGGSAFQGGARLTATVELGEAVWNEIGEIHKVSGATPEKIYETVVKMEKALKPLLDKVYL